MSHPILLVLCLCGAAILFWLFYKVIHGEAGVVTRFTLAVLLVVALAFGLCKTISNSVNPVPTNKIALVRCVSVRDGNQPGRWVMLVEVDRTIPNGNGLLRFKNDTMLFDEFAPAQGKRPSETNVLTVFGGGSSEEFIARFPLEATVEYRAVAPPTPPEEDLDDSLLPIFGGVYTQELTIDDAIPQSLNKGKGARLRIKMYNEDGVRVFIGKEYVGSFTPIGKSSGIYLMDVRDALNKQQPLPYKITLTLQLVKPNQTAGVYWIQLQPSE